jgi:hypothetical protein
MKDELSNYLDRPKRYDNIDGTNETLMGLMMLAFALAGDLPRHLGEHSFWRVHDVLFMYAILAPALALGFFLQKFVKRHITFPRTGYVAMGSAENPVSTKIRGVAYGALLGAILAVLIAVISVPLLMREREHAFKFEVARLFCAALFPGIYAFWIIRIGQGQRWKWILFCVQLAAMLVFASTVSDGHGLLNLFYPRILLIAGITWIVSGAVTFLAYIRHHQITPAK